MRKHNGMRPQDILILLKVVTLDESSWRYSDIAKSLYISQSEVAEGLHRSMLARLVAPDKRKVFRASLLEFLTHGLKYVFPAQPGGLVRGIPTAHSAPPLDQLISSEGEVYVWPSEKGPLRGQALLPLYPNLVKACLNDPVLYEQASLLDALRVGRAREQRLAIEALKTRINKDWYAQKETGSPGPGSPRLG